MCNLKSTAFALMVRGRRKRGLKGEDSSLLSLSLPRFVDIAQYPHHTQICLTQDSHSSSSSHSSLSLPCARLPPGLCDIRYCELVLSAEDKLASSCWLSCEVWQGGILSAVNKVWVCFGLFEVALTF